MDNLKKIVVVVIFCFLNYCILVNDTLSEEKETINNDIKVDEIEEMLETLKQERLELGKLKSKLVDTVKQKKDEKKAKEGKGLEQNEKTLLTNFVKKSVEDKEKLVSEQTNHLSFNKEEEVNDRIIQDSEDEEVKESKKVIINDDEIVHPFEIGESLYKSGEYKTAIEIYKLVLKNDVDKDKEMWITYQIANCYRKLGLYTDAIKVYREMRQIYEGTYWAKQAQWYIQDIEWRSKVEGMLDTVIE